MTTFDEWWADRRPNLDDPRTTAKKAWDASRKAIVESVKVGEVWPMTSYERLGVPDYANWAKVCESKCHTCGSTTLHERGVDPSKGWTCPVCGTQYGQTIKDDDRLEKLKQRVNRLHIKTGARIEELQRAWAALGPWEDKLVSRVNAMEERLQKGIDANTSRWGEQQQFNSSVVRDMGAERLKLIVALREAIDDV